jgi:ATP-binding cassette, subfamily B, bacterial MsbA
LGSLKRLLPFLRPYKGQVILIFFFGLVMSLSQPVIPYLAKRLFDDVLVKKDEYWLYRGPLALVLLFVVLGISRFFHLYILKYTSEKIVIQIRGDLQKKFMRLNLGFHNSYASGTGGLLSRVLNDVTILQWGLQIFVDSVREPITILAIVGGMFFFDWKLTMLFSIVAVPIIWGSQRLAKSLRKYSHRQQEAMEDFTSTLKETLDGVRIIQSFNLESEMTRRFNAVGDRYLAQRKSIIKREEAAGPVSELIAASVLAGIFVYVANEIFRGQMSLGTFMAFGTSLAILNPPIKKLQDAYLRMQQTVAATDRLFEILDNPNEVPQSRATNVFPAQWDRITFRNVSFSYGDRQVLKNVNLTVRRGEVIALVGESGSGKSTLVNLLGRFFDPTSGEILVGNTPIDEIKLEDLRKHIALVTQEVFLFNDSIARNIRAGDFSRPGDGTVPAAQVANAHDFIVRTSDQYETKVGDRGARLSGGEKQRVSIARAVYKDAPILILDEATSALDSASEVEVQKGLDQLMQGRTAFVIAHRLSTVIKADRILVLKDGQIVEEGQHEGLIAKNGHYYSFYKLQTLR